MDRNEFYQKYVEAAKKTLDPVWALVQWSWETGWATNNTWKYNNPGGIKYLNEKFYQERGINAYPEKSGYAGYKTMDDFVKDYNRVIGLNYLSSFRTALSSGDYSKAIDEFNKSAYAEADYNKAEIMRRIEEAKKVVGSYVTPSPGSGGGDIYSSSKNIIEELSKTELAGKLTTPQGKVVGGALLFGAILYLILGE